MRMKCPHCGVSGNADASLSGRKVKCPKCSRFFLVPVIDKVAGTVSTEIEEPLAPGDPIDSVIEKVPGDDETSLSAEEVLGDSDSAEQEETAELEGQKTDLEEYPPVYDDIDDADQPEVETDGEPEIESGTEVLSDDPGREDTELMDDESGPDLELADEQDLDEQEFEFDFPEDEEPAHELQDLSEEPLFPEGDDDNEGDFSAEEAFEDAFEELQAREARSSEDTLPEGLFEEQELGVSPATVDGVKEESVVRDDEFPDLSNEGIDWEEEREQLPGDSDEEQDIAAETVEEELRAELEAMLAGTCSACGRTVDKEETFNEDGRVICSDCFSGKEKAGFSAATDGAVGERAQGLRSEAVPVQKAGKKIPSFSYSGDFSVIRVLKEAWKMTSGLKGAVWAGILVMMLILFGLGAAAVMLPLAGAPAGGTVTAWINILIQLISIIMSMTFTAGLMYMGVRRVADRKFSWKMVFSGFSRLGQVAIAGILMTLLITSGFLLLILPGIYLAVGYSLTLPLILDRGLGPWEAMETSRRCVHRKWWPVFGAYLLMYPIYFISCIPFGLGMIWTIPMFIALSGVLYRILCPQKAE